MAGLFTLKNIMQLTEISVKKLHKIGQEKAKSLNKIGIKTIGDLLWHFPWRYDDLSEIKDISQLEENVLATVRVKILSLKTLRSWKRKITITEVLASDNQDQVRAIWFGQKFVGQILKIGDEIFLSGKPSFKNNLWQFSSPSYDKVKKVNIHSARLVPIYHSSADLSQKQLRFLINLALKHAPKIDDPLPVEILNQEKYPYLHEALQAIHFPEEETDLSKATKRLKFQELFYLQCKYQLAKKDYLQHTSWPLVHQEKILHETIASLPFTLTADQDRVLAEILSDLNQNKPMNRLVEGDVGSGKTIVAILAALNTIANLGKFQAVLMAPTEILAQQHFHSIQKILAKKYQATCALLTKDQHLLADKALDKNELLKKIKAGSVQFIIGTHALIQDKIDFARLALVIIDEQHRFGVRQRQALQKKSKAQVPHLLSLTATPIPRTLALTLYGDLDISLIQSKPQGRKDIKTILVPERKRLAAYQFVKDKIKLGQQVFVICPLIDESDVLGYKSVTAEYKKLNEEIFPDLEIGLLHGKLKSEEKQKLMADFKANKFPILVATSVIEVGVDIPQATVMIIESAERFGLSQLHQFRGRIGRNSLSSFCLLFTSHSSHLEKARLKALTQTNNGFELAELDLNLRGSGEIFGTKQSGLMQLKIATLKDTEEIKKAQVWAKKIMQEEKYQANQPLQKLLKNLKTEMHLE